jgi:hypothetical protein
VVSMARIDFPSILQFAHHRVELECWVSRLTPHSGLLPGRWQPPQQVGFHDTAAVITLKRRQRYSGLGPGYIHQQQLAGFQLAEDTVRIHFLDNVRSVTLNVENP